MGLVEQLQKYQDGNDTQLSIGDLNEMVEEVNDKLTCDDECQRQKEIVKLKKKYHIEKKRIVNAPHDLDNSRKKYFTYAFGEEYYDEFMTKKIKIEINKLSNKLALDHQHNYKTLTDSIDDYESIKKNSEYGTELIKKYKIENKILENKINEFANTKNINDRKVVYEVNEVDKLDNYNNQLLVLYWVMVLFFLILFFSKNMFKESKNSMVVFVVLLYPFVIYWIVHVLHTISNYIYNSLPKNMYLN